MLQDFRFAARQLRKAPGFTLVAIFTLALAIGVNSAMFAIVRGVVLRPVIPLRPQEVVNVFTARQNASHDYRRFSFDEFRALREDKSLFTDVAALEFAVAGIGQDHETRRSFVFLTSENFFSLVGVQPFRGRFYNAAEARPNANIPVVVASYSFWKRMGAPENFVGSILKVNQQPFTVIGVAPEGFSGVSALVAPDLWLPLGAHTQLGSAFDDTDAPRDLVAPKNYALNLKARMRPGLTIEAAKAQLPVLTRRLNSIQPASSDADRDLQIQTPSRFSISTSPEDDGPVTLIGTLLMAMAGAVLLIACLNLANMLLARGTARAKEIALRLALGASRSRIIRQLLCEGLLLAALGGGVGLIVSVWCNNLLLRSLLAMLGSLNFSLVVNLRPDPMILGATLLFCVLATLLFSLGPAIKATRADLVTDLKQQVGEPARIGRLSRFFAPRHLSVMVQIALSLMLLFSAGLFLRGAVKASGLNPGFVTAGGLVAEFDFSLRRSNPSEAKRELFAAVERVRALPGVQSAAAGSMLPYGNFTNTRRIMSSREAMPTDPKAPDPGAGGLYTSVTRGYFDAIGVKILRGRDFTQTEVENKDTPRVVILDEEMATRLFPKQDAIGQHVRYTQPPSNGSPNDMIVVGVVATHRHSVQRDNNRRIFVPFAQNFSNQVYLHVLLNTKDRRALLNFIPTLRSTLRGIDADLPTLDISPFSDLIEKSVDLWIVRLGAVLFGAFGGIALLLAVVGVYGVKAYAVACRTREIGIRMALGANRSDVFSLIMKQGALQTTFALGVGLLLALAAGRVFAQMLYQVSPSDPIALSLSALLLGSAALVACYLPARRATRVTPMTALRTE